ncbi:hypothetical protein KJ966_31605 [bacterium]|nr:hypothetical protein [bacterium]
MFENLLNAAAHGKGGSGWTYKRGERLNYDTAGKINEMQYYCSFASDKGQTGQWYSLLSCSSKCRSVALFLIALRMGVRVFSIVSRLTSSPLGRSESKVSAISSTRALVSFFFSDELLLFWLGIVDNSLIELTNRRFFDFCELSTMPSLFINILLLIYLILLLFPLLVGTPPANFWCTQ